MKASVVLCDVPAAARVPGFRPDESLGTFPFWGHYHMLDFALASVASATDAAVVVTVDATREAIQRLLKRHRQLQVQVVTLEAGTRALTAAVKAGRPRSTVVASAACVALFDAKRVLGEFRRGRGALARIKVDRRALDAYVGTTDACVSALEESLEAARREGPGPSLETLSNLFSMLLPRQATTEIVAPGKVLFSGNVRDLHNAHLWLVDNMHRPEGELLARQLSAAVGEGVAGGSGGSGSIAAGATVKNALLGAGCQIDGVVEHSFIFPDCAVAAGSRVVNSVIMSGNRIGPGAEIVNALLFPQAEREPTLRAPGPRDSVSIGQRARIGREPSNVANADFPKQIKGLTVVGMNPSVPPGMLVESGCYIDADVPATTLAGNLKLASGTSVFANGSGHP